jgi:hypothetical protein
VKRILEALSLKQDRGSFRATANFLSQMRHDCNANRRQQRGAAAALPRCAGAAAEAVLMSAT